MEKKSYEDFSQTLEAKVQDSLNQFVGFILFNDVETVKKYVAKTKFQTLEDYLGKSREELERFKKGVCDKYNNIISKLQDPNPTLEKLAEIKKEIFEIRDKKIL